MSDTDRFERFTERARVVLRLAEEEARYFQHEAIGTEHLLLGLLRDGESIAAQVLEALGVTVERLRKAVEEVKGRGSAPVVGEIGFTAHANEAFEMAMKEAERRFPVPATNNSQRLMGSIHMSESEALKIEQEGKLTPQLESRGVTLEQVSQAIKEAKGRGVQLLFDQRAPINAPTEEAERRQHPRFYVDTENLLLGVLRVPEGSGTKILQDWGVSSSRDVRTLMFLKHGTLPLTYREYAQHFTKQASNAWRLAYEEARRLQDSYVGTLHLLLGLVGAGSGVATTALAEQGIDLDKLREWVQPGYEAGDWSKPENIKLQPMLMHNIELAANEARRRYHSSISTGHLLLVLVRGENDHSHDGWLLKSMGVDLEKLWATLQRTLTQHGPLLEEEANAVTDESSDAAIYAGGASMAAIEQDLQSRELDKMMLAVYPFTIEARFVLEHARGLHANRGGRVRPEDLLMGLAYLALNKDTLMGKILTDAGIHFSGVNAAVGSRQRQQATSPVLVHSALGRACLLLAADEAERRGGPGAPIKSEHLLLGLLREEKGIIADLLTELGTSVVALRAKVEVAL
ncbi:Clp protease N-terminal domain-containing protein [Dictyobacter formicarum]|uniref:Clp R domain-containing protein n=1 Tax=Dictyobacter formicarum TaxID=2778368 RepID=A0ABQ3VS22_9CHLR|nr:Clp protease N-terminal domain-containing protein [Dictyobacter formicarum]GHO88494.1 hypothetical protein KSZ_65000 [Dictyobacter formicarum]